MSNITKVRIKQTDGTYSEEYPIGVLAENVDMGNSTNLSTKISAMDTAIDGKAPTDHASIYTTYGVATSGAYGHVKIVDNYTTIPQAAGPFAASTRAVVNAYNAVSTATNNLSSAYYAGITPKGYVTDSSSSLWTPAFGGSFSSSESICYVRQIIDHIFMITFAVKVSTAFSASVDRNIITNLPLAATRMYIPATITSYNSSSSPTTTKNIVLVIRPEESANSGRILKIEAGLNPYTLAVGDIIYSTFTLIGNK